MRWTVIALSLAVLIGYLPVALLVADPPPLMGDEAYYARVPIEMRQRGDWLVPHFNGEPRYKKPPLLYWLVGVSYALFGVSEASARLPSLLAIFATAASLVWFGKQVGAAMTGWFAATIFLLNPMTALLGNWGAPEAMLTFAITISALTAFVGMEQKSRAWVIVSGTVAGLAVMTKGVIGIVIPMLVCLPLLRRLAPSTGTLRQAGQFVALWLSAALLVAVPWFLAVSLREGSAFWQVFLLREHVQRVATPMEGHRGPIWFYLPVTFLALFPWSLRLPFAFVHALSSLTSRQSLIASRSSCEVWMAWWALSVVGLFSLVATKLPHYLFPALPALAWLLARQWQTPASRGEWVLAVLLGLPIGAAMLFLVAITLPDVFMAFLVRHKFAPSVSEFDELQSTLTLVGYAFAVTGVAAVLLISLARWRDESWMASLRQLAAANAAVLVLLWLMSVWALAHFSGAHRAARDWQHAKAMATFGSDTEWAVFYAGRKVPMFGDEKNLRDFLRSHPDAAVLARVDEADALRRCGLMVRRFGVWCVGRR
ncbi:MAG: glycosyltransferase family 39 protein [Armatimonadota bacterium]|nr:glycosyltransferase family 39 protein [Armatimonadota bacterium]